MKPCDLTAMREYASILAARDMPDTSRYIVDMADEIEALRAALRCELDEGDLENCGPRDDLRALLPPDEKGTDDAV